MVAEHRAALEDESLRDGLEYFWFAIGDEDFLLDTATASVAMFRDNGFDVTYHESGGGHTWMNWRDWTPKRQWTPWLRYQPTSWVTISS